MRMRRRASVLPAAGLVAGLVAGLLTGCGAAPVVDVAIAIPGDGRWQDVASVIEDRLTAAGLTVAVRDAGDDIPAQVRQVETLLDANPKVLIVAPVDASSLTPVLSRPDPDVEVIVMGALVRDAAGVDSYVAYNAAREGIDRADALLRDLGLLDDEGALVRSAGPPPRIELFAGSSDDPDAEVAFEASMTILGPAISVGAVVVGSGQTAFADVSVLRGAGPAAGSRLAQILRESYPDSPPDGVLAPSDTIARALAATLIDDGAIPGPGFPVITGGGCQLRSVVALTDGRQASTFLDDPRMLGAQVADRALSSVGLAVSGTAGPVTTWGVTDNGSREVWMALVAPTLVRAGDIEDVVVGSGYWSRKRIDAAVAEYGVP